MTISQLDYQAMVSMNNRIAELASENSELREKLAAYEASEYSDALKRANASIAALEAAIIRLTANHSYRADAAVGDSPNEVKK